MRSNIDDHWLGEVRFLSRSPFFATQEIKDVK
ncbi:uncharacterized protein METZ01_LOCUS497732 [marine metagenome]|uniref:Uncharacterized protein n=1 Tax=marine metagenome TaxID=408172 RepID=A0A383DLZ1_9ZZZZ